jgi:hypothetical protein
VVRANRSHPPCKYTCYSTSLAASSIPDHDYLSKAEQSSWAVRPSQYPFPESRDFRLATPSPDASSAPVTPSQSTTGAPIPHTTHCDALIAASKYCTLSRKRSFLGFTHYTTDHSSDAFSDNIMRGYTAPLAVVFAQDTLRRRQREIYRLCYEQFARELSEMRREMEKERRESDDLVEAFRSQSFFSERERMNAIWEGRMR